MTVEGLKRRLFVDRVFVLKGAARSRKSYRIGRLWDLLVEGRELEVYEGVVSD